MSSQFLTILWFLEMPIYGSLEVPGNSAKGGVGWGPGAGVVFDIWNFKKGWSQERNMAISTDVSTSLSLSIISTVSCKMLNLSPVD